MPATGPSQLQRSRPFGGKLAPEVADHARTDYFAFAIARYELDGLAERVWELRHNNTTYDAYYLALAEVLDAPLHTCDHKLATDGHRSQVVVVPRTH